VTLVTQEKLKSTKQKWNCKSVEFVTIVKEKEEFEARLYELTKLLYDEFCQRPKSLHHDLDVIQTKDCIQ
jgi:hypothetical protein